MISFGIPLLLAMVAPGMDGTDSLSQHLSGHLFYYLLDKCYEKMVNYNSINERKWGVL